MNGKLSKITLTLLLAAILIPAAGCKYKPGSRGGSYTDVAFGLDWLPGYDYLDVYEEDVIVSDTYYEDTYYEDSYYEDSYYEDTYYEDAYYDDFYYEDDYYDDDYDDGGYYDDYYWDDWKKKRGG